MVTTSRDGAAPFDVEIIETTLRRSARAVEANDVDGLLSMFHERPGTFLFDYTPPRSVDTAHLRETFAASAEGLIGRMTCEVVELDTHLLGLDAAWTASVLHVAATYASGAQLDITYRATDIWRRIDGRWAVVHEHASLPVDPITGRVDLQSAP